MDVGTAIEAAVRFYEEPPTRGTRISTPWADVRLSPDDWAEAFEAPDPGTPHNEAREQVWEQLLTILVDQHDDVVDESALRRGAPSANAVFGNKPSVLVGDFLFARAFQVMVADGSLRVLDILATASATIAEGEVLQLVTQNDTATTEEQYLQVIEGKTAALFAAATEIGAVVADHARVWARHQTITDVEHTLAAKLLRQGRGDLLRPVADVDTGDQVEIRSLGLYDQVLGLVDEEVS